VKITKARMAGGVALVAVAGASALGAAPTSAQKYDGGPKPITVRATLKGKEPVFTGPSKVERGARLTVLNETKPRKIGPHTFSLVKGSQLPKSRAEQKECGEELSGICGRIAKAHKVDPETFQVGKPDVDVGKKGWDKSFGKKGDSWYTETEDEKSTRKVTAKVGTKLTFFCAVHPNMQKKVRVVG
jgi:hypothetical protein